MDICEYKTRSQKKTRHPWEVARAHLIADLVGEYFMQSDGTVQLLDFGCGDGFITRTLADRYPSCCFVGVDNKLSEIRGVGEHEQKASRIEYLEDLREFRGENGSLDGALLLDVLEHISDDESFIEGFLNNKIFADRARFVITCPAFGKLFSNHDTLLGHYRRYSLPELRGKIERAGGVHLESGYVFFIPLVLRGVEVLLEKTGALIRRERTQISTWRGGQHTTSFVSNLLYFDAVLCRCLRRLPLAGLTCYIICQK